MPVPPQHDITIYQGDDFSLTFIVKEGGTAVDMSAVTAGKAQLRSERAPDADLLAEFDVDITQKADGQFTIRLTNVQTSAFTIFAGVYDVQLTGAGGIIKTYLWGQATIEREVTVNS